MTDDDDWLESLRGRPRPGMDPDTGAQAAALRAAVQQAQAAAPAGSEFEDAELQRLLFRLRREGLLDAKRKPATRWQLPIAAAAAVVLGVTLVFTLVPTTEDDVVRGAVAVQVDQVAEVDTRVSELRTALTSVGAQVAVTPLTSGRVEVSATIPASSLPQAQRLLAQLGLKPAAADGTLRVEVRPR